MSSIAKTLYEIFFENSIAYAEGYVDNNNRVGYRAIEALPTLELIEEHIDGVRVLGAYTVNPGNTVTWAAFDVDSKSGIEHAREIVEKISNWLSTKGIPHAIEFSGSKGYHVIFFFEDKESAAEVKETLETIRDLLSLPKNGDPHVEVFPKQGEIGGSNPFGNLLRLPLGTHPKTKIKTFFIDTTNWENGTPLDPEQVFNQKTTLSALKKALSESDSFEAIVGLLSAYWSTGQRHEITLCTAGHLASVNWSEEETLDLIRAIHEIVPEGDLQDQEKAVTSTYKKFYAGENVKGLGGLSAILPARELNKLIELAGKRSSSSATLIVDHIRLGKGATFLKVRSAGRSIISYLIEEGRLVRDQTEMYWLNNETHSLVTIDSYPWIRFMHNYFGINTTESFGRQTMEAVRHQAYDRCKEVLVKRRSCWHENEFYLNLGGSEIYNLTGDRGTRKVLYNGEIDVLFKNQEDNIHLPNLMTSGDAALSPWPFLTDDVNFAEGSDGTTAIQQREMLKTFFICTFFSEIMPTKPILAILAPLGQGKTTTARRFLRVIEGPFAEVLGISPDKPDSFRASIASHRYIVLDNLEDTPAKWLPDMLNRLSTGAHIELRELHTTNRTKIIVPECFISLTATNMPFSSETVYSRMLPILLGEVLHREAEHIIQANFINNYNSIWKGLIEDLDETVAALKSNTTVVAPMETRLADFSVFSSRIKNVSYLEGDELMAGIGNLVNSQRATLVENTPFVQIIETMMHSIPNGDTGWISMTELYARGQKVANLSKIEWRWTTPQSLSKHMKVLEPELIRNFGLSILKDKENGRDIHKYRFVRKSIQVKN